MEAKNTIFKIQFGILGLLTHILHSFFSACAILGTPCPSTPPSLPFPFFIPAVFPNPVLSPLLLSSPKMRPYFVKKGMRGRPWEGSFKLFTLGEGAGGQDVLGLSLTFRKGAKGQARLG